MRRSHIHAGTPDNFKRIREALATLRVPGWATVGSQLMIYVDVPTGTDPDEHQDALTALANAVSQ